MEVLDFFIDEDNAEKTREIHHFQKELIFAAIVFAVSVIGLCFDAAFSDDASQFLSSAKGKLWVFICSVKTVFAAIASLYTWRLLKKERGHLRKMDVLTTALIFTVVVLPLFLPIRGLLNYPSIAIKFVLLTGIAAWVSWLAMDGMLLIRRRLDMIERKLDNIHADQVHLAVTNFLKLKEKLQNLLLINGIIIGLSTLAAGSMRNALQDSYSIQIPIEYVIIYGAYFSGVLVITYLPTYIRNLEVGKKILNHYYPIEKLPKPHEENEHHVKWYESRERLYELLELNKSFNFFGVNGFSIFSPILGSIAGILIGFNK